MTEREKERTTWQAEARRVAIEEAAKVCDAYAAKMNLAAGKPHPVTHRENLIAICKADAGESLAKYIRSLLDKEPK